MTKLELGKNGENAACHYLERQEYYIMEKNFRCKSGEIDIIATDQNELVFIEVKTRCSKQYGEAREAVTEYKKKQLNFTFTQKGSKIALCVLMSWNYI